MNRALGTTAVRHGDHPAVLLQFTLLAAIIFALRWPFAWTSNEETYFILAHRLVEPTSYGPLDAVFDSSRGKWLGLLVFGWPVKLLGFEAAHVLLGFATVALTAAGLTALARMIGVGVLASAAALLTFLLLRQTIVGDEWFIGAVETKTCAYGLGLLALAAANDRRPRLAAATVGVAAYFHFLVGGFWLLAIALFLASGRALRPLLPRFLVMSLLLLLPLLAMLTFDMVEASAVTAPEGMPSADFIYSVLRAPHHVAPFDGPKSWGLKASLLAALAVLLAPAFWLAAARERAPLQALLRAVALLMLLVPLAVIASWFDRHHGALGKFYLFRPVSPLLLLVLFVLPVLVQRRFGRTRRLPLACAAVAAAALVVLIVSPRQLRWPGRDPDVAPLVASVRAHTSPGQVVLVDPELDGATAYVQGPSGSSLARKLGRPMYVSWKFVPTNPSEIYTWYRRLEQRKQIFADRCPADPRIGALILTSAHSRQRPRCGTFIYRDARSAVLLLPPRALR